MPNQFQRGFEGFGRAIPIRGMTPPAPLRIVQGPQLGAVQEPAAEQVQVPPPPLAQRPVPPGRIQVYKKGEPGAPPCPVCG